MSFENFSQSDSKRWTERVGDISEISEKASNEYWQQMPKALALRLLGKYAVFLEGKDEDSYSLALEKTRKQLGFVSREQILSAPTYKIERVKAGNTIIKIFQVFFNKLGSSKAFEEAKLATHYLNKYFKVDKLEVGDKISIEGGYINIWDKNGKQISNFPFVKVYDSSNTIQAVRESSSTANSGAQSQNTSTGSSSSENSENSTNFVDILGDFENKTPQQSKTSSPKIKPSAKTLNTAKKQNQQSASIDSFEISLDNSATATPTQPEKSPTKTKEEKTHKPQKTVKPNTAMGSAEDFLKSENAKEKAEKLKKAEKDRDKVYTIFTTGRLKRVSEALKNSEYKIEIGFEKTKDPEEDWPQITSSFEGQFGSRHYKNNRALVGTFRGEESMEVKAFGKSGDLKQNEDVKLQELTENPLEFLKKSLKNIYKNLPWTYRTFGAKPIFDRIFQILENTN